MIYIEVIETNLIIDENNVIRDHQSRVVEADSWSDYCKVYEEYSGEAVYFKSKYMVGNSIPSNCSISDLKQDKVHLSCTIVHPKGFITKRLAYRNTF